MNKPLLNLALISTVGALLSGCVGPLYHYKAYGTADKAFAKEAAADERFEQLAKPNSEDEAALSAVTVLVDSVPESVEFLEGGVVRVKPGYQDELLGTFALNWNAPAAPTRLKAIPAIQRAALAAGGNLAFCHLGVLPGNSVTYVGGYVLRTAPLKPPAPRPDAP